MYMVLLCSKIIHSKASTGFLRQDSQNSYNFGKIQSLGDIELSEKEEICCFNGEGYNINI